MLFGSPLRAAISRSGSASPDERNAESSCEECTTDLPRCGSRAGRLASGSLTMALASSALQKIYGSGLCLNVLQGAIRVSVCERVEVGMEGSRLQAPGSRETRDPRSEVRNARSEARSSEPEAFQPTG